MVVRQIVYFGYNQLLNFCYEMVEDHLVYCSVGLLRNAVLSVITMKVNAYINNIKKERNGNKCQRDSIPSPS